MPLSERRERQSVLKQKVMRTTVEGLLPPLHRSA
jgi:hypothetical protein